MTTLIDVLHQVSTDAATRQNQLTFVRRQQDDIHVSYADLARHAAALAQTLQHRLPPQTNGDTDYTPTYVVFYLDDNLAFIKLFWACLVAGVVPVPVAVGHNQEHQQKLQQVLAALPEPVLLTDQSGFAHTVSDVIDLAELDLHAQAEWSDSRWVLPEHTAFIQFSSGSTRRPKGVVLTHANLVCNTQAIVSACKYTADDHSLSWMPLTHDMGLIGFHLAMLTAGIPQVIMDTDLFSRRPLMWLEKVTEYQATITCSPNFGYQHYLRQYARRIQQNPEAHDALQLDGVRFCYNGAEPINVELAEEFNQTMARHGWQSQAMYPVYGLAEASLAVAFPPLSDYFRTVRLDPSQLKLDEPVVISPRCPSDKAYAVEGYAVPNCDIQIIDQSEQALPEGHLGEITIAGGNVTAGYLSVLDADVNQGLLTANGYLRTGDLGFISPFGLVVTGRLKDILFVNGLNLFPYDIEAVIAQQFDLPIEKLVVAEVDGDIVLFASLLTQYQRSPQEWTLLTPKIIGVVNRQFGFSLADIMLVDRIPKTTSGKVQRYRLTSAYPDYASYHWVSLRAILTSFEASVETVSSAESSDVATQSDTIDDADILSRIQKICAKVVDDKTLDPEQNFFDAGLSSLQLAQIHELIDEEFPDQLDITDIFDHPTMIDVARFIEKS